jgi:hypothetical protein
MEFTLKNVKTLNTYDGVAFTASIYRDGVRVGTAENSGTGGPNMINALTLHWKDTEALIAELDEWLKTHCAGHWTAEYVNDAGVRGDLAIDLLFERGEEARELRKRGKKNIIFRLPEDVGQAMFREIPRSAGPEMHIVAHIARKHENAEIWDGETWKAVA